MDKKMNFRIVPLFLFLGFCAAFSQTMHPTFPLLDEDGRNVLNSGAPLSTLQTCGNCHDADFISTHSFHSTLGFENMTSPGNTASGRAWDTSAGPYGRWNPILYRYLSPAGDENIDLTTPDWIMQHAARFVGGGPAMIGRDGISHLTRQADRNDPDASIVDLNTRERKAWEWSKSGVIETNCFLCHIQAPNNDERISAITAGQFKWANTATLAGISVVGKASSSYRYKRSSFDNNGALLPKFAQMQDPTNDNCGQCHGLVQSDDDHPLINKGCLPNQRLTETTGQIISPQRLSESGINLVDKQSLSRSWDVHAERVLNCTDCHYSINNPIYYREDEDSRPEHLIFSPRRLDIADYLKKPSHQLARGASSYDHLELDQKDQMRRCESCHDAKKSHDWLPYQERHMQAMTCESCHIPKLYAPTRRVMDWTVITPQGEPRTECRGLRGLHDDPATLVEGYEPVLLPRNELDGGVRLAPYNLITFWFWTHGEPERPVRLIDLKKAFFVDDQFKSEIVEKLDADNDGVLSTSELVLDSGEKVDFMRGQIENLGLSNAKIKSEIQPYAIHHNVARGDWVARDCESCHTQDSRLTKAFLLADIHLAAALPVLVTDANLSSGGKVIAKEGKIYYQENIQQAGFYIIGRDKIAAVQIIGAASVLLVLIGILVHGGLRVLAARRRKAEHGATKTVYMYSFYQRLWHWLQAITIIGLIFTGLIIHAPNIFGLFSFGAAVYIHNALALVLLINAALAVFYHFASGQIRHYMIEPKGFFSQAMDQAAFYLKGIFENEKHPFEKNLEKKLNPLQKVTYVAILNVLLPLQIVTGILIWGAQHIPEFMDKLGGLGLLVPFHSLIAWFFAAFLIMHMYLTTTGHTPTSAVKAMVVGWEEIEATEENIND
jgi:thiosulfate reductase cytochrome b subunit